jgi:hypothetical protein
MSPFFGSAKKKKKKKTIYISRQSTGTLVLVITLGRDDILPPFYLYHLSSL